MWNSYGYGRDIGEEICLGCLGLTPEHQHFDEFWIEYPPGHKDLFEPGTLNEGEIPDHPQWILDRFEEYDMVILFFWFHGCVPCRAQWDEMKEDGLVKGEEADGEMARYEDSVRFFSIDTIDSSNNPGGIDGGDLLRTYDADGVGAGAPTTVFLIEFDDGSIGWWSHDGRMEDLEQIYDVIEGGLALVQ